MSPTVCTTVYIGPDLADAHVHVFGHSRAMFTISLGVGAQLANEVGVSPSEAAEALRRLAARLDDAQAEHDAKTAAEAVTS